MARLIIKSQIETNVTAEQPFTHKANDFIVTSRSKVENTLIFETDYYVPICDLDIPQIIHNNGINLMDVTEVTFKRDVRIPRWRLEQRKK